MPAYSDGVGMRLYWTRDVSRHPFGCAKTPMTAYIFCENQSIAAERVGINRTQMATGGICDDPIMLAAFSGEPGNVFVSISLDERKFVRRDEFADFDRRIIDLDEVQS